MGRHCKGRLCCEGEGSLAWWRAPPSRLFLFPWGTLRGGWLEVPLIPSLTQAAVLFWLYLPALFLRNTERRGRKQEHGSESRCYLEKLDPDAGEHELKQCGDNHDVPNGPDGNKHALNHVLQWEERAGEGMGFWKCLQPELPSAKP